MKKKKKEKYSMIQCIKDCLWVLKNSEGPIIVSDENQSDEKEEEA